MIQAVVHLLTSSSKVQALVGQNRDKDRWCVYPVVVFLGEVEEDGNYICAAITGNAPTVGRCVSQLDKVSFDLLIYAQEYSDVDALANAARLAIDGFKGNAVGVNLDIVRFANEYDDFDDTVKKYLRVQSYQADVRRNVTV